MARRAGAGTRRTDRARAGPGVVLAASALLAAVATVPAAEPPAAARGAAPGADGASRCGDGRRLSHAFDSGAAWSLCARIDARHGLELVDVRYRAPGDRERPVLRSLHLGQLLVHWHDEPAPERRIGGATPATRGLGGEAGVPLAAESCEGQPLAIGDAAGGVDTAGGTLCARSRPGGLLAKYATHPALHGAEWELFAVSRQALLTWRSGVVLAEDGRIAPALSLSGRSGRTSDDPRFAAPPAGAPTATLDGDALDGSNRGLTRATLLATWRLEFALDSDAPDRVEEFEFPLDADEGRRPMRVRTLAEETFRTVAPTRFRGWRVSDTASGAGYYLDPLDSARVWAADEPPWAGFALALTRARDCERHAAGNRPADASGTDDTTCAADLDAFVDGETLDGARPVLWFGRTRIWQPRREDLPLLSSVRLGMEIVPFDWTATSPFENGG